MDEPTTAVLIHGCHLQADLNGQTWEQIVWGLDANRRPTLNGRGTMGLKVAWDYKAQLIIFSTGASEYNGMKEGEVTLEYAKASSAIAALLGTPSIGAYRDWLKDFSGLDLASQNTREECERNFRLCANGLIERIILVSSPWHIQRCHTEALKVAQTMRDAGERVPEIVAMASYGSTEDIAILEPPHRGDRSKTKWHEIVPRFFRVPEEERESVERGLDRLLKKHGA